VAGGSGGGGLYGGGGGGSSTFAAGSFEGPGGGGGGSGLAPGGAFVSGVRDGDGLVSIAYDPAAGTCDPPPEPVVPDAVVVTPRFAG
jgi:hypothetical protein